MMDAKFVDAAFVPTTLAIVEDYAKAVHDGDDAACVVLRQTIEASLEQAAELKRLRSIAPGQPEPDIQVVFSAQGHPMPDGSGSCWEVVADHRTRVAFCTSKQAAGDLAMQLNMAVTKWCEGNKDDRVANAA